MDRRPHVLVVDDEPGPRESLKMLLKPEFDVSVTARGSEALLMLNGGAYEVVLLDLTMPEDLSGTETLRAIRASNVDVEAIVITGQGALDTAVECLRLGARDYIAKPYRPNAVTSAVRSALATRAARRRAMQIREHFLGNLSHEFRTPLNAIVGYSEILSDEAASCLTHEHRHALSRIQRNSERLLSYLEGLFFLAELDSGDLPVRPRPFAVRPWLEKLLQPIRREGTESDASIAVECDEELLGHADPETLARLMGVLIYEAAAASAATVRIVAGRDSLGGLELTVEHDAGAHEPVPSASVAASTEDAPRAVTPGDKLAGEVIARAARALDAQIECESLAGGRARLRVRVGDAAAPGGSPGHAAPADVRVCGATSA